MTEELPCVVPWSRVQHTAERVVIVGTGPSLRGVDLTIPAGITVIAVNDAINHLPQPPDFWVTIDASPANRKIMARAATDPHTVYYAAVVPEYGLPDASREHYRDPPEDGVLYLKRVYSVDGMLGAKPGLSDDPTGIHVGNSGYGALNLAYLMNANKIALLGVDGRGGYAWGDGAPAASIRHLRGFFPTAVEPLRRRGIQVVVGSLESVVRCWPRMAPLDALVWAAL